MPILKGATKKLREAGIEYIQVRSGLWGPYLSDPRLNRQRSTVHKNWRLAIAAAIAGERPVELEPAEATQASVKPINTRSDTAE